MNSVAKGDVGQWSRKFEATIYPKMELWDVLIATHFERTQNNKNSINIKTNNINGTDQLQAYTELTYLIFSPILDFGAN